MSMGALWRDDDVPTMLLMVLFYRDMKGCRGRVSVAELLRRTQCDLYGTSVGDVKDMMADDLERAKSIGFESDRFVKKGVLHLKNAREYLNLDPLDPFTWAPTVRDRFRLMLNGHILAVSSVDNIDRWYVKSWAHIVEGAFCPDGHFSSHRKGQKQ